MSSELPSHKEFLKNRETIFTVVVDEATSVPLTLTKVSELRRSERQERFSLLFRGPAATFLPQALYAMKHGKIGPIDLFIVPVGTDEEDFLYEAVFNYLLTPKEPAAKTPARRKKAAGGRKRR